MQKIALTGGGLIGASWALVFARSGFDVAITSGTPAVRDSLMQRIKSACESSAALHPHLSCDAILDRIQVVETIEAALQGAYYVQESGREDLAEKQKLFAQLDALTPPHVLIGSSTSGISVSRFASELKGRERCIVVHPAAPPHLIPVVEIVPAPFTPDATIKTATDLMHRLGQSPVLVRKEQPGFVMNRLQGALLMEMFRAIEDGVMSPEDVDTLIRDGFALRWAFIGPLAGVDLNAPAGIGDYLSRYGSIYETMATERGWPTPVVTQGLKDQLTQAMRKNSDIDQQGVRIAWRDKMMAALGAMRRGAKAIPSKKS